jgi:hypothetical protein
LESQGLRGVREHDPKKLWSFYLWKLGRFCFESMLLFTDMFESTEYAAVLFGSVLNPQEFTISLRRRLVAFAVFAAVTALRGYCVWLPHRSHSDFSIH